MLKLELLEGRSVPTAGMVQPPTWGGYAYSGLPDFVDNISLPTQYDAVTVAHNIVAGGEAGPGVDVRVDFVGPGGSFSGQMSVVLWDVSNMLDPEAVDCSTHTVCATEGSQWTSFTGLQSNHIYVIRATWADQTGGMGQTLFYCP